jgi:hypothetical protein
LAAPPTLDQLFHLPVPNAAAVALGPGPEVFVERSPWNSIAPNYVMNTLSLFGMTFYTRAEHVSPLVCRTTMGWVEFNTLPDADASAEEKAAQENIPYAQKPLRWINFNRHIVYFVAGIPLPVPILAQTQPEPLSGAALKSNNCENPVSGRKTFEASSSGAATAAVTDLHTVLTLTAGKRPLPFALRCGPQSTECIDPRATLKTLTLQALWQISPGRCPADRVGRDCTEFDVDDTYALGQSDRWWKIVIAKGPSGKIESVVVRRYLEPVI